MKNKLPPNNPSESVRTDMICFLFALNEASKVKIELVGKSEEWKEGYDQAIFTVISAFMLALAEGKVRELEF